MVLHFRGAGRLVLFNAASLLALLCACDDFGCTAVCFASLAFTRDVRFIAQVLVLESIGSQQTCASVIRMAIERELKFLLSQDSWQRIYAWAQRESRIEANIHQSNTYFDTQQGELADVLMMIRIREKRVDPKPASFEITFKHKLKTKAPGQHSLEVNAPLDKSQALALIEAPESLCALSLEPILALQKSFGRSPLLTCVGATHTHRARIQSPSGSYVLELDHTRYLGEEDWELECETQEHALHNARVELETLFESLGVQTSLGAKPKYARFMAALARRGTTSSGV